MAFDLELFNQAAENLKRQKLRSLLTLLGIIIGIGAVVALISIGDGFNKSVEKEFEKLGSNTLIVLPGSSFIGSAFAKLQESDVKRIESVKGVESATPIYLASVIVSFKQEKKSVLVLGIDPKKQGLLEDLGILSISQGRQLTSSDNLGILVGSRFAENQFDSNLSVRQELGLDSKSLRIVGIIKAAGQAFGAMFDNAIVMNYKSLEEITGQNLTPYRIFVKSVNKEEVADVKERITKELKRAHGEEDFQILSATQILDSALSVLGLIQLILVFIAAISLLVGGIGIMNTMLMAVMERTEEIGVMKAVGATNNLILSIFLMESGIIGLVGGFIGYVIGLLLAFLAGIIASTAGFDLIIGFDSMLFFGSLAFAFIIGLISGFIPAQRAAKMDPVEALRQE
ncbi:ABC transporter permease [Candidatus Micrarchaeota archaeon]|nr:ABC transporter permease [Candidatus Micrarchaeota archaeon]MBU2476657.1 ABC transporter permease [Candidatus Micrarchaeota archaeon]